VTSTARTHVQMSQLVDACRRTVLVEKQEVAGIWHNASHLGVVNKLQWWVLSACGGRTLLTTPYGHTVDNMQKS